MLPMFRGLCVSVRLSVSCGILGSRNNLIGVIWIVPEKGQFSLRPLSVEYNHELCKKAEPIEMSFGLWTRMGPSNNVLVLLFSFSVLHFLVAVYVR